MGTDSPNPGNMEHEQQQVESVDTQNVQSISEASSTKESIEEVAPIVLVECVAPPANTESAESVESTKALLEQERVNLEQRILAIKQQLQEIGPNYIKPHHLRAVLSEEAKATVRKLLASPATLRDMKELIEASRPPSLDADDADAPPVNQRLIVGKVIQRWSLVALTTEGLDPEKDWSQTDAILDHIRGLLKRDQAVDTGLCAFWIANLTEVVSGMHHFIINANPEQTAPVSVDAALSMMAASFGKVAWAVPVVTSRQKIVKFVEEVLSFWLTNLYVKLCSGLRHAIMEDDGSGPEKSAAPSKKILSFLLSGGSKDETPDLDTVLASLHDHILQMNHAGLDKGLTSDILGCICQHVSTDCFNMLMRKKKYATSKRVAQAQANLVRVEDSLSQLPIDVSVVRTNFASLLQVAELLQGHQSVEDLAALQDLCPDLSLLQIRRALVNQAAAGEDGPVNPLLLQALDQQIEADYGSVPVDDAGTIIESKPIRFDIAAPPRAPAPFEELPDDLPPSLQQVLMLTRDTL